MNTETFYPIMPEDYKLSDKQLGEITFDCQVKMFRNAIKEIKGNLFVEPKYITERVALKFNLTMESIELLDNESLGKVIKEQFNKLKAEVYKIEHS